MDVTNIDHYFLPPHSHPRPRRQQKSLARGQQQLFTLRDIADTVDLMTSESDLDGTSLNYIELAGISRDQSGLMPLFFIFLLNFCRGRKALAADYMY